MTALSPLKGTVPVSISYRTTPTEYRSERSSTGWPLACSGARYWAVPRMEPASVIPESPARAMPKSMTLTVPPRSSMTFCGLMSRCTMPLRWANSTAASSCIATATDSLPLSLPRRRMRSLRVSPSTYSMTM